MVARRERAALFCARVALDAPARGRSASPLEAASPCHDLKPWGIVQMAAWYNALSDRKARLLAAAVLAILLIGAANYYLAIGLFGRFGKALYILSVAVGVAFTFYFVVPRYESRKHPDRRGAGF